MAISEKTKQLVRDRAGHCCEYCLLAEVELSGRFHVDHIISLKHEGSDEVDNLCYACSVCNFAKGSDIASRDPDTGSMTELFNPRLQHWHDHFYLEDVVIIGRTPEGRVTVKLLNLNHSLRIAQRSDLLQVGDYPCIKSSS